MSAINRFLLEHNLRIATNPCVSPDFCLDWPALREQLAKGTLLKVYPKSRFEPAVLVDRITAVVSLADQRHRGLVGENRRDPLADQRMVVDAQHADRRRGNFVHRHPPSVIDTAVPFPGTLRRSSVAPMCAARSRMPITP